MDERYFEAAYLALRKCVIALPDDSLDESESLFRQGLIELCREITEWDNTIKSSELEDDGYYDYPEDEPEDDSEDYWEYLGD